MIARFVAFFRSAMPFLPSPEEGIAARCVNWNLITIYFSG